MLTPEQIENNKQRFLQLISQINIEGADTAGLVEFLLNESDFFTAPASTQYHASYEGGLCQHSLNVYDNLVQLVQMKNYQVDPNSILIVALLHDISKANFYESYVVNKKVYDPRGTKHDNLGNFNWFAETAYKTKESSERMLGGTHGFNSMMLVGKYIPLSYEENVAIYNHHMGMDDKNATYDLTAIANKYTLVTLLHVADMLACYVDEKVK